MKYQLTHITGYASSSRVSVCHNAAWLTPRQTGRQQLSAHSIETDPASSTFDSRIDTFGNTVTYFSFNQGYKTLSVTAKSVVTVDPPPKYEELESQAWEVVAAQVQPGDSAVGLEAVQFLFDSPRIHRSTEAAEFARKSFLPGRPIVEAVQDLTDRIHHEFEYDPRATTVTTPVADVLKQRRGVCQDFAHAQIAMLRTVGLAARYVSGYVRSYPPEGKPRLVGADASHAWISVFCGDLGWVDVDATNNKFANEDHIILGWGRDYGDVTPLKGVYTGGGKHTLTVSVDVAPWQPATF